MGRKPFVREKILDAAFDLFAKRGYEAVSTREIANQAKVGHASMYRHFSSKEKLGREVYKLALKPILLTFKNLEKESKSPTYFIEQCIYNLCVWYDTTPRALALLIFPPHDFCPEELKESNKNNPRSVMQRVLKCDNDTLAVIWGAITGPLQDRYLKRRTGKMEPVASSLQKIVNKLLK